MSACKWKMSIGSPKIGPARCMLLLTRRNQKASLRFPSSVKLWLELGIVWCKTFFSGPVWLHEVGRIHVGRFLQKLSPWKSPVYHTGAFGNLIKVTTVVNYSQCSEFQQYLQMIWYGFWIPCCVEFWLVFCWPNKPLVVATVKVSVPSKRKLVMSGLSLATCVCWLALTTQTFFFLVNPHTNLKRRL